MGVVLYSQTSTLTYHYTSAPLDGASTAETSVLNGASEEKLWCNGGTSYCPSRLEWFKSWAERSYDVWVMRRAGLLLLRCWGDTVLCTIQWQKHPAAAWGSFYHGFGKARQHWGKQYFNVAYSLVAWLFTVSLNMVPYCDMTFKRHENIKMFNKM